MIDSIQYLRNAGTFRNFSWPSSAPGLKEFSRFNIVYGTNGSGKSTLCRFLGALNEGSHPEYPSLDYRLLINGGTQLTTGSKYPQQIRVFNTDYIKNAVGQIEGAINPIFIIGPEKNQLVAEIAKEEAELASRTTSIQTSEQLKGKEQKIKDSKFTNVAKVIATSTSGQASRIYRKDHAEAAFKKADEVILLGDRQVEGHRQALRQDQMADVADLPILQVMIFDHGVPFGSYVDDFHAEMESALKRKAGTEAIERLLGNPKLAAWIEQGLHIHTESPESTSCEFCQQVLPPTLLQQLTNHFSEDDQALKEDLEYLLIKVSDIDSVIKHLQPPPQEAFYKELQLKFEAAHSRLKKECQLFLGELSACKLALEAKIADRAAMPSCNAIPRSAKIEAAWKDMQDVITQHRAISNNFESRQIQARAALESHHLAEIYKDVRDLEKKIEAYDTAIQTEREKSSKYSLSLEDLRLSIDVKKAQVANTAIAAKELTEGVQTFLGRDDLVFVPENQGYRIQRNGVSANLLSEGEKTAIAFVYFIVHLKDQNFSISAGSIVIDDPISSLDSGAIYQAFSFLKWAVSEAKQVFLLTHNFEFLQLLINWRERDKKTTRYYMTLCGGASSSGRESVLAELDPQLRMHSTEYNYLFKILYKFEFDSSIASNYPLPNMARKFMETFLLFQYPECKSLYDGLNKAIEAYPTHAQRWNALYKYANDLSHHTASTFNPALIPATQANVKTLLEMVAVVSKAHYDSLVKSLPQT